MAALTQLYSGALLSNTAASLGFFVTFVYLYNNEKLQHLRHWALFWGFAAIGYMSLYQSIYLEVPVEILYNFTTIGAILYLLKGVYSYTEKNMGKSWGFVFAVVLLFNLTGIITGNLTISFTTNIIFLSLSFVISGILFCRYSSKFLLKTAAFSAIIFGITSFFMPYLMLQEWLQVYGQAFQGAMGFLFGISLIGAHYETLQEKLELTQYSVDKSDMLIFRVSPPGEISYANDTAREKLGYEKGELVGTNVKQHIPEEEFIERQKYWQKIKAHRSITYEQKLLNQDGETFPIKMISNYFQQNGEEFEFAFARDITQKKKAERKMKIREKQYRTMFTKSPAGMMLIDKEGKIIQVNDSICNITGYDREELEGSTLFETVLPEKYEKKARENIADILSGEDKEYVAESVNKNGELYNVLLKETRIELPDGRNCVLSMQIDYTKYKKQQEKIKYISFHDNLTDLYNRSYMEEEMDRLDAERQMPISIIVIDVNGLKIINDTYGHERGDQMLKRVANILRKCVREEDIIARWAGDEFIILLPQTDKPTAKKIGQRIREKCKKTKSDEIPISLGIGIKTKTRVDQDIYEVVHEADEKMYQDKLTESRSAKNRLVRNLLTTLGAKSGETEEHALRMTDMALALGRELNLTNSQLNHLSLLATLHDIGKVTIPEEILRKPDDLDDEEWEIIKEHPERGYRIAAATEEFAPISNYILYHHERWDGSGYPQGVSGEEIPLLSRIISIVDAYDVMTNGRPYKEPLSQEEALEEILSCSGSQFDPELAETFVEVMKKTNISNKI